MYIVEHYVFKQLKNWNSNQLPGRFYDIEYHNERGSCALIMNSKSRVVDCGFSLKWAGITETVTHKSP